MVDIGQGKDYLAGAFWGARLETDLAL